MRIIRTVVAFALLLRLAAFTFACVGGYRVFYRSK